MRLEGFHTTSGRPLATRERAKVAALALAVLASGAGCGGSAPVVGGPGPGGQATRALLQTPEGLALDADGNLYVSEFTGARVVRISPSDRLSVVAGTGKPGDAGDGGPAVAAQLSAPTGLAFDAAGNLAIADFGAGVIREVDKARQISTIAPTGPGVLDKPLGIAFHGRDLYVADEGHARVLEVQPSGAQTALASGLHTGYLAVDGDRGIFLADVLDHRVRELDITESAQRGVISLIAGTGQPGSAGDAGPSTNAQLTMPYGLAMDSAGNLYISDRQANRVRRIDRDGTITTVAGTGTAGFGGDGGPATKARLNAPAGLAVDARGDLYIADGGNDRIRRVDPKGTITTVAGRSLSIGGATTAASPRPGGPATHDELAGPEALAFDARGDLFVSEFRGARVVEISPHGRLTAVAGTGASGDTGDGGPARKARLFQPTGIAVDRRGDLAIAEYGSGVIRRVSRSGIITTVRSSVFAQLHHPVGLALLGGNIYVADPGNRRIVEFTRTGASRVVNDGIPASYLLLDGHGDLYISNLLTNEVVRIDPKGIESVVAGTGVRGFSGDGGPATRARLDTPYGLAMDANGNLYVCDRGNNRVRKIDRTGIITTVAGTGGAGFSGDGGPAVHATLNLPSGLAVDGAGELFIADSGNNRVRRVDAKGVITTVAGR